ncbi:hypothetical protein BAUCODRAFT_151366 [Baudoinia panamericana UAMH 10762]|uniref:PrsW family intramembrane metalloprotease n=1 Tax=Baudoinia panamericana (strain UAMH 10762) TaxID=717646 RepID=M2MNG9_BAUPA|nr:uncharacterized protein BAUCODRAFT_151366 [Baudoinia panamericana UAMH 10762]EMC92988.1 hypothetical protein BAUCODRAFT_151366 [Baudoinia panamericana UAMH 10762]
MPVTAQTLRWLGMPAFLALASIGAPHTALSYPILLLPTLGAVYSWHYSIHSQRAELDTLTTIYFLSATVGMVLDMLAQALLAYGTGILIFGDQLVAYLREVSRTSVTGSSASQLADRASMAASWRYYLFLLLFNYLLGPPLEEAIKYAPIAWYEGRASSAEGADANKVTASKRKYLHYAVAAALGFATSENIAFVRAAVKAGESPSRLAITVLERTVVGGLGHAFTAALIAVNAAKYAGKAGSVGKLVQVLGPSVLYHGTLNMVLLVISALNGNVGWIHPTNPWTVAGMVAAVAGILLACFLHVRHLWRKLSRSLPAAPEAL